MNLFKNEYNGNGYKQNYYRSLIIVKWYIMILKKIV